MHKYVEQLKKKQLPVMLALGIILILTLALASTAFAGGDDTPTISVESVADAVAPGTENIQVAVSISNNPGIAGFNLEISYDEGLTLTAISNTGILSTSSLMGNWEDGLVAYDNLTNITGDGVLFYLTFSVEDDATPGDKGISVSITDDGLIGKIDTDGITVLDISGQFSFEDGSITVEEGEPEEDTTPPILNSVDPEEGSIILDPDEDFVLIVSAYDETELAELEVDHSMEGLLPEFSVYADSADPYGSPEDQEAFESYGVSVAYDDGTWTIDFGPDATDAFVANGGITFYLVIKDAAGNAWGSMYDITDENTFIYTITREEESGVWDGTIDTSWYNDSDDEFTLTAAKQLAGLAAIVNGTAAGIAQDDFADKTVTLGKDIVLNEDGSTYNWTPIGTAIAASSPAGTSTVSAASCAFAGTLDGDGCEITGLYISSSAGGQGLFGFNTGTIKDLTVSGTVTSTTSGDFVGGIAAFNRGVIQDVIADVTVNAGNVYNVGGIVGFNDGYNVSDAPALIQRCANLAAVTGFNKVGGIAGENAGTIRYCYNDGRIDGTNASSKNGVGGVAGRNGNNDTAVETGIIESCYNAGTVGRSGQKWVGGITGFQNSLSSVKNSYVSGTIVAGAGNNNPIVGNQEGAQDANNYSLDTLYASGSSVSEVGIRLTDAALQDAAPLLGGAFVNDTEGGYPLLFWQEDLALSAITVKSGITNGAVTAPAQATEGTTVLVTVTPADDYVLKTGSLTYTVAGEDPVAVTENEGVYSFVMPAKAVTISAAFIASVWDGTADTSWYNTSDTSFTLYTAGDLAGLAAIVNGTASGIAQDNFAGKTVKLGDDIALDADGKYTKQPGVFGTTTYCVRDDYCIINAGAHIWTPIGTGTSSDPTDSTFTMSNVKYFAGTFDGQNHQVSGLYTTRTARVQGLFGCVSGTIQNLTVSGCVVAHSVAGGIVAYLNGGSVTHCVNNAIVTTDGGTTPNGGVEDGLHYAGSNGGIVGRAAGTSGAPFSVTDCVNNAYIAGLNSWQGGRTGGIIGLIGTGDVGTVSRCVNNGYVSAYQEGGGIVGKDSSMYAPIDSCVNKGNVKGHSSGMTPTGGIAATTYSSVSNCYNTGTVAIFIGGTGGTKSSTMGGIVASFAGPTGATISNCYSVGNVGFGGNASSCSETGSICSSGGSASKVVNCYTLNVYALKGDGTPSTYSVNDLSYVTVKTDNEMKDTAYTDTSILTLLGAQFMADSATHPINNGYPVLRYQAGAAIPSVASISIDTPPTKTAYAATETFNPAGMKVKVTYSDGSYEFLTTGFTYPADPLTAGTTSVTISYGGKTATQTITVDPLALDSIAVTTAPTKIFYINGESFDKTGMVVQANFNGTLVQTLLAEDYTVTPAPLTTGLTEVTISYTYEGVTKTATTPVTVLAALPALVEGYYELGSADELNWFANYVSVQGNTAVNVRLTANITLTSTWTTPIGINTADRRFTGTFDGNGKSISGLNNTAVTSQYFGLFGYISNATVKDLTVTGQISTTAANAALVAGYADGSTFINVTANGSAERTANNSYLGGIAGNTANACVFTNCVNNASVTNTGTSQYTGGIAGYVNGASVFTNCVNNGAITSASSMVGGIASYSAGAPKFEACLNNGTVTGNSAGVGGIVGYTAGTTEITGCHNKGVITGAYNAGGIVGTNTSSKTIANCSNSGAVNANTTSTGTTYALGGIVGGMTTGAATINQCFNSGAITGSCSSIGGLMGYTNVSGVKLLNSYNLGPVTYTGSFATADIGGVMGYASNASVTVQNCYNVGKVTANDTTSGNIAGVIGYAAGLTNVSNNYYLNTTATRATGNSVSANANAQAKTSSAMSAASFVTTLGDAYKLGNKYPALTWQQVAATGGGPIENGSTVQLGSEQNTSNIVLNQDLLSAMGEAEDVSLELTTSNGVFSFNAAATGAILDAAGDHDVAFSALQLTESTDPDIQTLINGGALVFEFSLTANGSPIFTEGASAGQVVIKIPYALGFRDPEKITVYYIDSDGVKHAVEADYAGGYITFTATHFSTYSIEYEGLNIRAEFADANTHFNGGDQISVKVYAKTDTETSYGSYQADVDFSSAQLTFNRAASTMATGTNEINLVSTGKVRIGYTSEGSEAQPLNTAGTLLATLVFDVKAVATDSETGYIGMSNASFGAPESSVDQSAAIGADIAYTLHNIRLTFQAGTGTTLTTTYAYVKYNAPNLYTDATYTTPRTVPVPTAATNYRLAADTAAEPRWKNASATGYTSADIAAGAFTVSQTFTAQAIAIRTVTFYDSTGAVIGTAQTVDLNACATAPDDPTLTGHDFKGWFVVNAPGDAYVSQALLSKATIDATPVTANIRYKARFTPATYDAIIPGTVDVSEGILEDKATFGVPVKFTLNQTATAGYINSVSYSIGGVNKGTLAPDGSGVYTIPGSAITGALEIIVNQVVDGTVTFIGHDEYMAAANSYKILVFTSNYSGMNRTTMRYKFNTHTELFYSEKYDAYVAFVDTSETAETALSKLSLDTAAPTVEINYDGDVNQQNGVTTLDAQIIYDLLNSKAVTGITDLMRFCADYDGSETVTTHDAYQIICKIFNITD